jgi:hypothetical protein
MRVVAAESGLRFDIAAVGAAPSATITLARKATTQVLCACGLVLLFLTWSATPAFALAHGAGGWATWSNGSSLTAYGNRGEVYAYTRPSSGAKVNSIYVRAPGDPNGYLVEAGYTSTGSNPPSGLPANHDPWFFSVNMYAGVYTADDFSYQYGLPVGERTRVSLVNTSGAHNWDVYYAGTHVTTWWDTAFMYGYLTVGEERSLTSVDARASITYMERLAREGSAYTWYYWWNGVGDGYDDAYSFRFNHVGDSNHWVYCDDHNN